MPRGVGRGQNVELREFCHCLTLLPPGASVFHKHMSSLFLFIDWFGTWKMSQKVSQNFAVFVPEKQGSKLTLANSQNASWNSVLRVENIGTRKKLRVLYFIYYRIPILVSKMFQQVYSKGSGKVEAPRNTDSLSCHVTAMAEKIM